MLIVNTNRTNYLIQKFAPGLRTTNNRAILLLCSKASVGCVIKPGMLYKSVIRSALKNQNNGNLPMFWRANKKVCVRSTNFCYWLPNCFAKNVEIYLKKKNTLRQFQLWTILRQTMHPNIQVIVMSEHDSFTSTHRLRINSGLQALLHLTNFQNHTKNVKSR